MPDYDDDMLPPPSIGSPPPGRTYTYGNSAFHNFANDYSHIADPNLRRRLALSEIDKVPFGMYRKWPSCATLDSSIDRQGLIFFRCSRCFGSRGRLFSR